MANKPSNTPLVIGVGLALVLLLGANMMAQNNNPEIQEKLEKQKQEEEAKKAPKSQEPSKIDDGPPPAPNAGSELVMLGEKSLIGPKDAKKKVTVGYEWTPAVQGNPNSFYQVVEQVKKMAPEAAIEVVNIDSNPAVPAGVSVDGKVLMPVKPDGTLNAEGNNIRAVMEVLKRP